MAFHWLVSGGPEEQASQSFPTQADAEAWLSESWAELANSGATQVTLYSDDHVVYGPMSLDPA